MRLGVLPFLLLIAVAVFTLLSDNFLTGRNLLNVARQSTYLIMVSMGQMFALLTGGFDLSVGTILAVTSVVGALAMSAAYVAMPDAVALAMALGLVGGFAAGFSIGILNGVGVALFNVSPFMMTLGMASIGFGIALYLTGGVPVYGMPQEFGDVFGFGSWFGLPAPVWVTVALIVLLYLLVNWTRLGRYFYAVGGNIKAARLSGINTRLTLFTAYVLCGGMAATSGLLLTARLETGEANIGASMPLESIAACVIAGVSLRGGVGRIENVVLGALFIGLIQNGMNLARIESYLQTVVIGVLLILAVVADQFRLRYIANLRTDAKLPKGAGAAAPVRRQGTGRTDMAVAINCDMGEGFGLYRMGDDAAIMPLVTVANVACGFHASDPSVMHKTVRLAKQHGVKVGAHPSLPDLQGFGRREMKIPRAELDRHHIYQVGALKGSSRRRACASTTSSRMARSTAWRPARRRSRTPSATRRTCSGCRCSAWPAPCTRRSTRRAASRFVSGVLCRSRL